MDTEPQARTWREYTQMWEQDVIAMLAADYQKMLRHQSPLRILGRVDTRYLSGAMVRRLRRLVYRAWWHTLPRTDKRWLRRQGVSRG